ncbi:MAG: Fic family protein [Candidatus Tritonobacter lacicola]|nr:Fic family protein [Candidatus Tritonobacter lacicola]
MDNNKEKKVMTFKSGQLIFSRRFSDEKLCVPLAEAGVLYKTVADLPILPDLATQLEEELIRRSIFGTAAIEGNPLSEEKVAQVISEAERTKKMRQAEKEIQNLKGAYDYVRTLTAPGTRLLLSEDIIRTVHRNITDGLDYKDNAPGAYRNHRVNVGDLEHGGRYTPPKCLDDIRTLMKEFTEWINREGTMKLAKPIRAALAHYYLGLIHPFGDGNGRTARLIEALLLRLEGIKFVPVMLSNYYYRNIDSYFIAFSNSIHSKEHDITAFLEFVLQGHIESLREIKERVISYIRVLSLGSYYRALREGKKITQRQYDLLDTLLNSYLTPFTRADLFNVTPLNLLYRRVSDRTARRDLDKLTGQKLLVFKNGKYTLNTRILETG